MAVFVSVDGPTSCREEPNHHKSQVKRRDWAISFVDAIVTTLRRLHPSGNSQILREKKATMEFPFSSVSAYNAGKTATVNSVALNFFSFSFLSFPFKLF